MRFERALRKASLSVLALGAVLTFAVAAQAAEKTVKYNLANGANSTPIKPVANKPVFVMGDQTTAGNVGSGEMTVVNSNPGDGELVWSALESDGGGPSAGFSPTPGTHILFIDFGHCVDLEVNDASSFVVHNACGIQQTGSVTLTW